MSSSMKHVGARTAFAIAVSSITGGGLGAAIGHATSKNKKTGALLGALIGSTAANILVGSGIADLQCGDWSDNSTGVGQLQQEWRL